MGNIFHFWVGNALKRLYYMIQCMRFNGHIIIYNSWYSPSVLMIYAKITKQRINHQSMKISYGNHNFTKLDTSIHWHNSSLRAQNFGIINFYKRHYTEYLYSWKSRKKQYIFMFRKTAFFFFSYLFLLYVFA